MKSKSNFITLKDIAESLGISINAVSKALRDCPDISSKTKEIVKQKAHELGYIPNSLAISLKQGSSKNIALIFNDFYNPYFSNACFLFYNAIQTNGYIGNVIFVDESKINLQSIEKINLYRFSAIISLVEPSDEVASFFGKMKIPFYLFGIKSNNKYINSIYTDDFLGGKLVGETYLSSKCTNALILSDGYSETTTRRLKGFLKGSKNKNSKHVHFTNSKEEYEKLYESFMNENFDFVFCFSDSLAISIKDFLKTKGYQNKYVLFGYDDLYKYNHLLSKVNSVGSNMNEMVNYTVNKVLENITSQKNQLITISKMFPVNLAIYKKF